jgi:NADH-quinone oxidoreductase subunit L
LPDAMAGPTPVSALIHAATMVTAGVYMIARMHAVYMLVPSAMAIVAVVGAATAMFAAIIGFAQNDFKKVLAYSTVSQLGFMFAGVGTANFDGGVFHLVTHAFFKAGLFLCAGSVMHAMSGSGDIRIMGGLRKRLPWTHGVFFVCWLAICGIPIFSGFFSKDSIIAGAFATEKFANLEHFEWVGKLVGVMLMVAALGTAFYMSRLYFLVFSGDEVRADEKTRHHIHESPAIMIVPLVVLAAGATLIGFIGLPGDLFHHPEYNLLAHELDPVLGAELEISPSVEVIFMLVSTTLAVVGIALAMVFYRGGYKAPARAFAAKFPGFLRLVQDKFRIDEVYDTVLIRPIRAFSRGVFAFVDRIIVDKILVEGTGLIVDVFSRLARSLQGGDGQRYMAVFAVGVALLVHFAIQPTLPFTKLKVTQTGRAVEIDARRGNRAPTRSLEYAYDFGDGRPAVKGASPAQRHDYDRPGSYTIRVTISDPLWGTEDGFKEKVEVR